MAGNDPSSWFLVAAEVIFIMLVGESLETSRSAARARASPDCFGDIHPPLEVVPAFRDVSIAMEEKEARINEAQAYQYQARAAARRQAAEQLLAAAGFAADRRSAPRPPRRGLWKLPRPMRWRRRSPACGSTCNRWRSRWRAHGK